MDKYIYDENNGLWYELVEDYYIPCLTLLPEENKPTGIWDSSIYSISIISKEFYIPLC